MPRWILFGRGRIASAIGAFAVTASLALKKVEDLKKTDERSEQNSKHQNNNFTKTRHKIINDPIHGFIQLTPIAVRVIDTPQFQRLRNISQLGGVSYVYPGATHSRFQHSIGTYHLAGCFLHELKLRLKEVKNLYQKGGIKDPIFQIKIEPKDIICVELAALCHDLGHGPFSHMFDGIFMKKIDEESTWTHEKASCAMLDHTVKENNLLESPEFKESNIGPEEIQLIKEFIIPTGKPQKAGKEFLYEIVSNKRSGIDVDKWDYIERDFYHLGMKSHFDKERFMKTARIVHIPKHPKDPKDVTWTIAYRERDVNEVHELFHTRLSLHQRACKHPVAVVVEQMITDALQAANKHLKFKGSDGKDLELSQTILDMSAYEKVTDEMIFRILRTEDEELRKARRLLRRIIDRDFYYHVGQVLLSEKCNSGQRLREELEGFLDQDKVEAISPYLIIYEYALEVGMAGENPEDKVRFYRKDELAEGIQTPSHPNSKLKLQQYMEKRAHIYFRTDPKDEQNETTKELLNALKEAYAMWEEHRKI